MDAKAWDGLAAEYFDNVISPFQEGVDNPVVRHLKKIPRRRQKVVGDLGCGVGNLLPTLAPHFKKVYALDFSAGMLKVCRQRHRFKNVAYLLSIHAESLLCIHHGELLQRDYLYWCDQ